jgi:hypothetical protein
MSSTSLIFFGNTQAQGAPLKKIVYISEDVYKGITNMLLRDKIEIIEREDK